MPQGRFTERPAFESALAWYFVLVWGSGYLATKAGLQYAAPFTFLALRFAFGLLVLVPLVALLRPAWPAGAAQWAHVAAAGLLMHAVNLGGSHYAKDGFFLPESKNAVGWRDADHLYVGTDFGPGSMTTSGYPRIAKLWKRGTPLEAAETVYEGKAEDMMVAAQRDHTKGFERDFVYRAITFYTNELFLRRDGRLVKVEKPDSANASVHRDLLLLELRDDWTVGGRTFTRCLGEKGR